MYWGIETSNIVQLAVNLLQIPTDFDAACVEDIRANGAVVMWPSADTAGTPPAAITARFPGLVPEVPRSFERAVQGRLPLLRIGWALIRPASTAAAAR